MRFFFPRNPHLSANIGNSELLTVFSAVLNIFSIFETHVLKQAKKNKTKKRPMGGVSLVQKLIFERIRCLIKVARTYNYLERRKENVRTS